MEETFYCFIEKLRNLVDSLNGYNAKIVNLKNDIRRRIECNQVNVSVLGGYVDVIESNDAAFLKAIDAVESYIQSMQGRKKCGENGFNFSQIFGGLFGGKPDGSKTDKLEDSRDKEAMDVKVNNRKQANILSASVEEGYLNSVMNGKLEDKTARIFSDPYDETVRSQNKDEDYIDRTGVKNEIFEYQKKKLPDKNCTAKSVFNHTDYSYRSKTSRLVNNEQVYLKDYDQDENEAMPSHHSSYDSEDFIISMKHIKTASSFGHRQKLETGDRNYWQSECSDEDRREFCSSFKEDTSHPQKQPSFTNQEPARRNVLGSAPSSIVDDDLEFSRYLSEANDLFKEAKGCLRHQVNYGCSENALYKSAVLLSKAIEIRPMSLLAVEKLGNTYLLHGELKLRISRELRSHLARKQPFSIEGRKVSQRSDDHLTDKEKIKFTLVDVCEECEELLIKAGRKYKLALSIDGNDMRALYNWGIALSFRAQLIADIGPSAARDADQVFMAAVDKFEAMMSKSNDYAPDALRHRSRLRPGRSREKVKLLQQARCLYEDALYMDSGNLQLQEALSSCVSELDYLYS